MKYRGQKLSGPRTKVVPILRDDENIFFTVRGLTDLSEFDKLCPPPKAPKIMLPGGNTKYDVEDKGYIYEFEQWAKKRSSWVFINSVRPLPEGMEWETVDYSNPDTWVNWEDELKSSGFVPAEVDRLVNAVMDLNGVNPQLVEEALKSFLTIQDKARNGQSSHQDEAQTSQSGSAASK